MLVRNSEYSCGEYVFSHLNCIPSRIILQVDKL